MADFPILFTGKEVSFEPRSTGELERSNERFQQRLMQAEEFKYKKKEEGRKEFFQTLDMDPIGVVSEQLAKEQSELLNQFNDRWASKYKEYDGNLPDYERMVMMQERKRIEAAQQNMLKSQSMFERDMELIKRDSVKASPTLDIDKWVKESYLPFVTGESSTYESHLSLMPLNASKYFRELSLPGRGAKTSIAKNVPGGTQTTTEDVPISTEESRMIIRNDLEASARGDKRLLNGVIQDFLSQPEQEKEKWLVEGDVDTPEERNAILRWAEDYYVNDIRRVKSSEQFRPAPIDKDNKEKPPSYKYVEGRIHDKNGNEIMRKSDNIQSSVAGYNEGFEITSRANTLDLDPRNIRFFKGIDNDFYEGIKNNTVKARPTKIANNRVEFVIESPVIIKKSVDDIKEVPDRYAETYDFKGGKYTWEERIPSGTIVGVPLEDVYDDLAAELGGDALDNAMNELNPDRQYKRK